MAEPLFVLPVIQWLFVRCVTDPASDWLDDNVVKVRAAITGSVSLVAVYRALHMHWINSTLVAKQGDFFLYIILNTVILHGSLQVGYYTYVVDSVGLKLGGSGSKFTGDLQVVRGIMLYCAWVVLYIKGDYNSYQLRTSM